MYIYIYATKYTDIKKNQVRIIKPKSELHACGHIRNKGGRGIRQ